MIPWECCCGQRAVVGAESNISRGKDIGGNMCVGLGGADNLTDMRALIR